MKVTDFGIAKAAGGDDLTRTGTVVGHRPLPLARAGERPHRRRARRRLRARASCSTRCWPAVRRSVATPTMATAVGAPHDAPAPIRAADGPEVPRRARRHRGTAASLAIPNTGTSPRRRSRTRSRRASQAPTGPRRACPPTAPAPPPRRGPSPTQRRAEPAASGAAHRAAVRPQGLAAGLARAVLLLLVVARDHRPRLVDLAPATTPAAAPAAASSGHGVPPIVEASAFDPFGDGERARAARRRAGHRRATRTPRGTPSSTATANSGTPKKGVGLRIELDAADDDQRR